MRPTDRQGHAARRRPAAPPRRGLLSVLAALAFAAACGDATGPAVFPPPDGPPTPLRIARVVSSLSAVEGQQAAEFTWEGDRLVAYRFDALLGDAIDATIRKEFLYHPDGRPFGHDSYRRQEDGSWRQDGAVRYSYGATPGLPIEAHRETLREDGSILVSSVGFGYDEYGRIVEIRDGPETTTFRYDRNGDIAAIRGDDIRFGVQVKTLDYGEAWNPFAAFPPLAGTDRGIFAPEAASLHLATRWENAVEGEAPAAVGTAVIVTNELGYPTRREWQLRNTSDPDVITTVVAEYEYNEYLDP
ncbi:MAG TPA: hypothetical protein VMM12_00405 [Longimicrobiales bacterium]|nr:hypothetical protein [Longimicrobiales bacterium]